MIAPQGIIADDPDVLPALRGMFSQHPVCLGWESHELAEALHTHSYMNRRPHDAEVEAALEGLIIEGEVFL